MISETKRSQRKTLLARRAALSDKEKDRNDRAIRDKVLMLPEFDRADVVFSYISQGTEVDSHGLIEHIWASRKSLLVPRIIDNRSMVAVAVGDWDELAPATLGILSPKSDLLFDGVIDLCITPGLGFSPSGQRLGFGKAYYDRWFIDNDRTLRIGLAYECQLLDELSHDDRDVPMHILVTEERVIRIP